ncbi:nuclear transport factor 2 family protein [Kerstersia sp.]|uniref:nuclear transport factor 2 family protein n=1 Tax=Kerstersia sp. TaxID=1930783 RepID=UPI003F8DAA41
MPNQRSHSLQQAHRVLDWNRKYLNHGSALSPERIGECFAPAFVVEANGRRYQANHQNYQAFLEDMKRSLSGIEYQVDHEVADEHSAVFAMRVTISKVDGSNEHFNAVLLTRFDAQGKVTLWHEVYVPQPGQG